MIFLVRGSLRIMWLLSFPNDGCIREGLIVSVSQGNNDSDIQLVRDLVESHIKKPSCLILLTVTCESKVRNIDVIAFINSLCSRF